MEERDKPLALGFASFMTSITGKIFRKCPFSLDNTNSKPKRNATEGAPGLAVGLNLTPAVPKCESLDSAVSGVGLHAKDNELI